MTGIERMELTFLADMAHKEIKKLDLCFGDFGHPRYRCRDPVQTPVEIERFLSFTDEMEMRQ